MEYNFREIEKKWQRYWKENDTYKTVVNPNRPKYYVLEMFPYPSGAGLHVGHPLGYIAGDIYARYKRLKGFNVLHPMGYDAYGLPAEQYAIQTGQHPAITTEQNIKRYREQLDILGFSYDWSREVRTCDLDYYKWTQWAFMKMFNSYYSQILNTDDADDTDKNADNNKKICENPCHLRHPRSSGGEGARPIEKLIAHFEKQGTEGLNAVCGEPMTFSAAEWKAKTEKEQMEILLNYRLAYLADMMVNWCPALGTVLANDEVVNGVSVRGGHPVERKLMKQWSLRITAYAQRLLDGLDKIEWSDSLKEIQRNWIGRSEGGTARFDLTPSPSPKERGNNEVGWTKERGNDEGVNAKERGNDVPGYVTTNKWDWNTNIGNAKEMRREPTEAEEALWTYIRNRNIDGLKFRRQHLIDRFIVDFVCLEKSLVIEVDGSYHYSEEQKQYDEARTKILNDAGFKIIRFTNDEV
ncbi:MAG: DUF559 domain-containing protein, partial [Bacteroidales bacterium]|nr:DUF559 domain-containing protein [Bacteroidales bacterium]